MYSLRLGPQDTNTWLIGSGSVCRNIRKNRIEIMFFIHSFVYNFNDNIYMSFIYVQFQSQHIYIYMSFIHLYTTSITTYVLLTSWLRKFVQHQISWQTHQPHLEKDNQRKSSKLHPVIFVKNGIIYSIVYV